MTVSNEQFKKIAEIANLEIISDIEGRPILLENDKVSLTVQDRLGVEPVTRFEQTSEGLMAVPGFEDLSGRQWIHVSTMPKFSSSSETTPSVHLSLEDAHVRYIPEGSENPDSGMQPQRAVLTDLKQRAVIFDRSGEISIRSAGLPQDYTV